MLYCFSDQTGPQISCLTPQIFYADRDTNSSFVEWQLPTAVDEIDQNTTIIQIDGQEYGSLFQSGSSVVKYIATDSQGNESPECTIEIRVEGKWFGSYLRYKGICQTNPLNVIEMAETQYIMRYSACHSSQLGRFCKYILPRLNQECFPFYSQSGDHKHGGTFRNHREVLVLSLRSLASLKDQVEILVLKMFTSEINFHRILDDIFKIVYSFRCLTR